MSKFRYIVTEEDKGLPVKKLIRTKFSFSSRLMTKLKIQKLIYLNGEQVQGWITPELGDVITVELPEEKSDFPAEDIPITPVYEDDDIMIINKQPGVTVHPTKGHPCHTLANGLMKYMEDTSQSFKIRFINRLDMDTSGCIAVAKNSHAQDDFTKQMKANTTRKEYLAIVNGIVKEDDFTINLPIGRPDPLDLRRRVMDDGYPSITHVHVVERFKKDNGYTLIQLLLETGRTHQIRVHMTHLGHILLGDKLYGDNSEKYIDRQALHAYRLSFKHPVTGEEITAEAPLPSDMERALEMLRE